MGNAENSFKMKIPCFRSLFETWSTVRLRAASSTRRSNESPIALSRCPACRHEDYCRLRPSGCCFETGIVGCIRLCAVYLRCGRSVWREGQALPVNRTMPGKRVLPTVACEFAATTLKGLGGIRPAFFSAARRKSKEVQCRQSSSGTRERLTTKQFSAG